MSVTQRPGIPNRISPVNRKATGRFTFAHRRSMIDSPFPSSNFPLSLSVAYLLLSHVLSATPPQSPRRLSSPRAFALLASRAAPLLLRLQCALLLPRLSVPLPSFLRPSSFLRSLLCLSRRSLPPQRSPSSLLPSPSPHFIENVWYAGAFYTGTEPPPCRSGLMAGKEQPGRLPVRTFVSARSHAGMRGLQLSQPRF